ncbi:hypothetical protein [Vibrio variabilis]|uniref:hypothetical protein n=1 Tax=Vibrio variabilis TaxID=990271 RepID=UPI000DDA51F9|nr:hypothetical protein [Vibrio variabilis]
MAKGIQSKRTNGKEGWADIPIMNNLEKGDIDRSLWCQFFFANKYDSFESSIFSTAWKDVSIVLSQYQIPLHLSRAYLLDSGVEASLPVYLLQCANKLKSTKLQATASLVDAVFLIEVYSANGLDTKELLNDFYGYSYRMALSMMEDEILAGASRTSEASIGKTQRALKNKERAIELALEKRKINPLLCKADLGRMLANELGVSAKTISETYLKDL